MSIFCCCCPSKQVDQEDYTRNSSEPLIKSTNSLKSIDANPIKSIQSSNNKIIQSTASKTIEQFSFGTKSNQLNVDKAFSFMSKQKEKDNISTNQIKSDDKKHEKAEKQFKLQQQKEKLFSNKNKGQKKIFQTQKRVENKQQKPSEKSKTITKSFTYTQEQAAQAILYKSQIRMQKKAQSSVNNRSQLWDQETGTKIIFFYTVKDQQMVFDFKIRHICSLQANYLPHIFSRNSHYQQFGLCLVLNTKGMSQTKAYFKQLKIKRHIKPIFALYRQDQDSKITKFHYQNQEVYDTIITGCNCFKLEAFDMIIISLVQQKDFNSTLELGQKLIRHYQLQDLAKITWILNSNLSLSDITHFLSKVFRKFLISEPIQKNLRFLSFQIQMVEGSHFSDVIILKNSFTKQNSKQTISKQFQVKLQLAIGMLQYQVNTQNVTVYQKFANSYFSNMTILNYLKYGQFLHNSSADSLQQLKFFSREELLLLQSSNKIQQKSINAGQRYVLIKDVSVKRMSSLFIDYRHAKTPINDDQIKKQKEWDDDLMVNDIVVGNIDKQESGRSEEQNNLFEEIGDQSIEVAPLDILANFEPSYDVQQHL